MMANERYSVSGSLYQQSHELQTLLMQGLLYQNRSDAAKRLRWIYQDNPGGVARVCTLTSPEDGNKVFGVLGLCCRHWWQSGSIVRAAVLSDLVIDKAYRSLGPALKLTECALEEVHNGNFEFIYGWPNEISRVLTRRLPSITTTEVGIYTYCLDWKKLLTKRLGLFWGVGLSAFPSIFFRVKRAINAVYDNLLYKTAEVSHFDTRFDELWERSRKRFDLIGVRDSEFLTWRFNQDSGQKHRVFTMECRHTGRLCGYIVHRLDNFNSCYISDFLSEEGSRMERCLFSMFFNSMHRENCSSVSVFFAGHKKCVQNLLRAGFMKNGNRPAISYQMPSFEDNFVNSAYQITQADNDV